MLNYKIDNCLNYTSQGDDARAAFNPAIAMGLVFATKLTLKDWIFGLVIHIVGAFVGGGIALILENTNLQTKFGSDAYAAMFGIGSDVSVSNDFINIHR